MHQLTANGDWIARASWMLNARWYVPMNEHKIGGEVTSIDLLTLILVRLGTSLFSR